MTQTSVEWIYNELVVFMTGNSVFETAEELFKHGKKMHKEEIIKTAVQCHFQGVRQQPKNSEEYLDYGEQHYNEQFKTK